MRLIDADAIVFTHAIARSIDDGHNWNELCVTKDEIDDMPSAEPERKWTAHEVACLLAELFGDDCACNYNGIDEWLPEKCELQDACPNPVGVACWEQFLKWRGDR